VTHETKGRRPDPARVRAAPADGRREDVELVQAILRRDRKATAEFVTTCADPVYAYVRRRLFPRVDLVDDLVQDVFVAALESIGTFAGASSLRTWLLSIARHKVEDHYRACVRQATHLSELEDGADSPDPVHVEYDDVLDTAQRHQRIDRVLTDLPEAYRNVLLWRYWEQRSAREMAVQCGKTEKAIERLLARARSEFRRRWNEG
jgi:RNA polymerase sigma-70 factor (ECF subfamily)